jgi:mercuric ion transport protein
MNSRNIPLMGGIFAAMTASVCCVVPLVLVFAGLGGAWLGMLAALDPFRPYFIALTVGFLAWGWYRLYRLTPVCTQSKGCDKDLRRQRQVFWSIVLVISLLLTFPWYIQWLS